jgi:2-dehydropantoate 2-reductase
LSSDCWRTANFGLPLNSAARVPGMLDFMRQAGYEAIHAAVASGGRIVPIFGMPAVDPSRPEKVVVDLFDEVLKTFSMEDTLTTTLQDWRKGRRGETDDVNGYVVHWLEKVGKSAPSINKWSRSRTRSS